MTFKKQCDKFIDALSKLGRLADLKARYIEAQRLDEKRFGDLKIKRLKEIETEIMNIKKGDGFDT